MVKQKTQVQRLVEEFFILKGYTGNIPSLVFARYVKAAGEVIELCDGDLTKAVHSLKKMKLWAEERGLDWGVDTVVRRWMDLQAKPAVKPDSCYKCGKESALMISTVNGSACLDCA